MSLSLLRRITTVASLPAIGGSWSRASLRDHSVPELRPAPVLADFGVSGTREGCGRPVPFGPALLAPVVVACPLERVPVVGSRAFSTSGSETPTSIYEKAVAAGELKPDPRQRKTIARLQTLHDELLAYAASGPEPEQPQQAPASSSLFSFFGGGQKPSAPPARASKAPKGLYIYGGVGCGKTMMMDMFFDSVPASHRKVRKHFHTFMLEVHQRLHKLRMDAKAKGTADATDPLRVIAASFVKQEGKLLCFDEFQVTDVADAMILKELFSALFEFGCVVVATSNRPPSDLYLHGINRERFLPFISILQNQCEVVPMENLPDYRMLVTAEKGLYHSPLSHESSKALDSTFASLAAGAHPGPVTVSVMMGRQVTSKWAVKGRVAKFTFDELCNHALGAADYIAIAKAFPVVLLADIPVLYFDNREKIRRFITLLDVMYEHRTQLIMTADAVPQQLFRPARSPSPGGSAAQSKGGFSEDEVFASSRAISRLVEMTSSTYLQNAQKHGGSKDTPLELQ